MILLLFFKKANFPKGGKSLGVDIYIHFLSNYRNWYVRRDLGSYIFYCS